VSGLVVSSVASLQPSADANPAAVSVAESGVWGGGLLTTLAQDPADPAKYLVGGDG
jgi:hypothetical protein